jgi:phosphoglycolate phosphatase-like HAD superfamily hydrolase
MQLALFDIDGTLILSGGAGLRSLSRTFADLYGLPNATDGIPFHGHTDPAIVQAMARQGLGRELDTSEFERVLEHYLEILPEQLATSQSFRVLPGARELVESLASQDDWLLGLATGNFEPAAFAKLERGDLAGHFAFGGFGSDSANRVELTRIAVARGRERAGRECPVVVIGDTIHDVRAAHEAGADCLAVATGNASVETLEEAGARWVVETLKDPRVGDAFGL